MLGGDNK